MGAINTAQGAPKDLGGTYRPELVKAAAALRPSPTFNAVIDAIRA